MRLEQHLNGAITYEQYWRVASNPLVIDICLTYWLTVGTGPAPATQEDIADVEQPPAIVETRGNTSREAEWYCGKAGLRGPTSAVCLLSGPQETPVKWEQV